MFLLEDLGSIGAIAISAVAGATSMWFMNQDKKPTGYKEKTVVILKLEAQKISPFSGDYSDWSKWKSRTECAFDGSGYEKILIDRTYASLHERLNKVVYSQLSVATVDGNAHHLVKEHEKTKDIFACWLSLCTWYDGDTVKNETSEDIRAKI